MDVPEQELEQYLTKLGEYLVGERYLQRALKGVDGGSPVQEKN